MTVVYVDTLFLLNLTIDYLLLRLSARICGQYVPTLRLALGALMGAVYALCAFLPQGHFLTYPPVKVAVGVALALTAFGGRQRLLRLTLVFFACACALGGGVLMVSLLGSGGLTYANGIQPRGWISRSCACQRQGVTWCCRWECAVWGGTPRCPRRSCQ